MHNFGTLTTKHTKPYLYLGRKLQEISVGLGGEIFRRDVLGISIGSVCLCIWLNILHFDIHWGQKEQRILAIT